MGKPAEFVIHAERRSISIFHFVQANGQVAALENPTIRLTMFAPNNAALGDDLPQVGSHPSSRFTLIEFFFFFYVSAHFYFWRRFALEICHKNPPGEG